MSYFPMNVVLTPQEILWAGQAAIIRQAKVIKKKRGETYGSNRVGAWHRNVEACLAEYVAAWATNRHWRGPGADDDEFGIDFGDKGEARWTNYENGHLLLHREDKPAAYFFLVIGEFGTYRIPGWIRGIDGQREEWWREPKNGNGRPCFNVPQSALNISEPPDDL